MTARKPANLLLVDDDPSLLKLLGMRLTSEGFHVTTAESGGSAAPAGARTDRSGDQRSAYGRDGRHGAVRRDPKASAGHAGDHPHRARFDSRCGGRHPAGVFSFLTKPVDRDALYKAIDEALALSATPAGDEARAKTSSPAAR